MNYCIEHDYIVISHFAQNFVQYYLQQKIDLSLVESKFLNQRYILILFLFTMKYDEINLCYGKIENKQFTDLKGLAAKSNI